ncbi:Mor transcription activator family protein [Halarcobacter sp.]|uniref:Mor transcription activator family protein n=1 Tax=Halarcobacter sp. TaxID=2321133 RepID=UPI0029F4DD2B|nr:Mor transcription activator family protein [Halarcobacter sp.]
MSAITNLDLFEEFFKFIKKDDTDLEAVIKEFGGTTYYIPSYKTTLRNEEILKEYKKCVGEIGLTKKLSKKYNLTERQIQDITKEARQASSLF